MDAAGGVDKPQVHIVLKEHYTVALQQNDQIWSK